MAHEVTRISEVAKPELFKVHAAREPPSTRWSIYPNNK
jgi:hypothetical protein